MNMHDLAKYICHCPAVKRQQYNPKVLMYESTPFYTSLSFWVPVKR